MRKTLVATLAIGTLAAAGLARAENAVEVVHWWTSGPEATAVKILIDDMQKRGFVWKDSPIAGGGDPARTALRARVAAGNPPEAIQLVGFAITNYGEEGMLGDVTALATREGWESAIPLALQKFAKYQGKWVAAPVDIHRTNWVWADKKIFDKLKISPPKTFDELMIAAGKIKKAGHLPLAHGNEPWQDATLFDSAVLSAGGPDFYRKAMIDLDDASLTSATMERAFTQLARLKSLQDPNNPIHDWNLATAMVVNGKAAMQIMGDWAKMEFLKAGKKPGVDFLCFDYPGTEGSFVYTSDQFAMFKVGKEQLDGQARLASAMMDRSFQERFSLAKGSIPARMDVVEKSFDACGKKSMVDLRSASQRNTLVGSFAHGYAVPDSIRAVMIDVVSKAFNSGISAAEASKQLAAAVKAAKTAPH